MKPGIMYRAVTDLFEQIDALKASREVDLFVTFLEIYNEHIHDLLVDVAKSPKENENSPEKKKAKKDQVPKRPDLPLLIEKNGNISVQGLSIHPAPKADDLMQLLAFGNKNRTQHATDANATSSRSHAVFTVHVRQKEKSASISSTYTMSKLVMVDLAGSERAAKVAASRGQCRVREGANINKSLQSVCQCESKIMVNIIVQVFAMKRRIFAPYFFRSLPVTHRFSTI